MNISRVEIIDGEEYIKLDFARDMLKEEREYKDNLIKYLEDKIKEPRIGGCDCLTDNMFETEKRVYQDILERIRNNNYEM